jgi:hypothetical protein
MKIYSAGIKWFSLLLFEPPQPNTTGYYYPKVYLALK